MTRSEKHTDHAPDDSSNDSREQRSASMWTSTDAVTIEPGRAIGPYIIKELLGEGGHGEVYLAEQTEPVKRLVAIKVIKPGMDSKAVIARFEQERQSLAVIDHPNVARVLDAGTFLRGVPYFVMDYVDGEPITVYCDRKKLAIRERLELLINVCDAVQHAHMKGIIHRDLKPSNILVADGGRGPIVKVIDFGVAKALSGNMAIGSVQTEQGQLIGTPEYMSPEQAAMGATDIDTRSDVYSLGVVLYELLAGALPLDSDELRQSGFGQVASFLRQHQPPKPSTRFPALGDNATFIASNRRNTPTNLRRELSRELDWIPLKAIRADRAERYRTASDLADDIRHYLRGEPLDAGPATAAYHLRKFVRRNRPAVAAVTMIVLLLTTSLVGVSIALTQVAQQREIAEQREREALAAKDAQVRERERAEAEAERALAAEKAAEQSAEELQLVAEFQVSQLSDLDTALMGVRLREEITNLRRSELEKFTVDEQQVDRRLHELEASLAGVNFTDLALTTLDENIFQRALATIEAEFNDQPLVRARLLQTLATTMYELGMLEQAMPPQVDALALYRRELGDEHYLTLASFNNMGYLFRLRGEYGEAKPLLRKALEGLRRTVGPEHAATLTAMHNLGFLLQVKGQLTEAEPHLRESLDGYRRVLGDMHSRTFDAINAMGQFLQDIGQLDESEAYYREALDGRRRVLGDDHTDTLISIHNMGFLHEVKGNFSEAEQYYREALDGRRRTLGDQHQHTLLSISNMGALLYRQDRLVEAEPYFDEALSNRRLLLGDNHPQTLIAINNMAALLRQLERLDEAEQFGAEAVERARRVLPEGHWHTASFLTQHAHTLGAMSRYDEAVVSATEAYAILDDVLGPAHDRTVGIIALLADLYEHWNEHMPDAGHDAQAAKWRSMQPSDESDEPDKAAPQANEPSS